APLEEHNSVQGIVWQPQSLVLLLRDEGSGEIVGGLLGETHFGWLRVSILAVAARLRGQGWGQRLMREAERIEAQERGCHDAWVDTFSFQARPFYERLGYRAFGQLEDYPKGQTRYFLTRSLSDISSSTSP